MSENSKIEWTDHTFNPWEGCQKVGPGCDNCYAETRNARFGGGAAVNWGPSAPRRRTSPANWRKPLAWNRDAGAFYALQGRRQRVFCSSLADVFDNAVDPQWRVDLFRLITDTPNLDWLLLTKRIGNVDAMMQDVTDRRFGSEALRPARLPDNVWLGATIVNQAEADRDIPKLLHASARVRFLSMEPLLGQVDLRVHIFGEPTGNFRTHEGKRQLEFRRPADGGLHWVIVGGESGHGARPMHPEWARSLRDQCVAAGVPFLFKQWGEYRPGSDFQYDDGKTVSIDRAARVVTGLARDDYPTGASSADGWTIVRRVGKKAAGRALDGVTHDSFPGSCA